jgi:hypothetical protein
MPGSHAPAPERFASKIEVQPNGCHHWTRALNDYGYGVFQLARGKSIQSHIYAWMLAHGGRRPPKGKTLDHRCHDPKVCLGGPTCPHRRCVNADHLRVRSRASNAMAGNSRAAKNKVKTHCPFRHAYSPDNTTITGNRRKCRTCARLRARAKRRGITYAELLLEQAA